MYIEVKMNAYCFTKVIRKFRLLREARQEQFEE